MKYANAKHKKILNANVPCRGNSKEAAGFPYQLEWSVRLIYYLVRAKLIKKDINNFLQATASGNAAEAKEVLNDLLSARAFDALDTKKTELAQTLFGNKSAETNNPNSPQQPSFGDKIQQKANVLIKFVQDRVEQTKDEAKKFQINQKCFDITNYDQLKNIKNINEYSGIVLDESSILKGRDGKLSNLIIESFKNTPYK